jgi:hypothetical protein
MMGAILAQGGSRELTIALPRRWYLPAGSVYLEESASAYLKTSFQT